MARPHKPWYRADRKTWYVQVAGKQHPLAKGPKAETKRAAYDAMNKLLATVDSPDPNAAADTVAGILAKFLGWTKKHKSPETYEHRRHYLKSFVRFKNVRNLRPERVSVELVEDWLDSNEGWKASRRHATLSLLRAFNWAVKRKRLASNPIAGIEVPVQKRVLSYLTKDQRKAIYDATRAKSFKHFLTALEQTGWSSWFSHTVARMRPNRHSYTGGFRTPPLLVGSGGAGVSALPLPFFFFAMSTLPNFEDVKGTRYVERRGGLMPSPPVGVTPRIPFRGG